MRILFTVSLNYTSHRIACSATSIASHVVLQTKLSSLILTKVRHQVAVSEVFGHLVVLDQLHGTVKRCSLLDASAVDYQTGRRGVCAYSMLQ